MRYTSPVWLIAKLKLFTARQGHRRKELNELGRLAKTSFYSTTSSTQVTQIFMSRGSTSMYSAEARQQAERIIYRTL